MGKERMGGCGAGDTAGTAAEATSTDLPGKDRRCEEEIEKLRARAAALQESEGRFRQALENANLVAVQLDRHGRILFANRFLAELTGWSLAEILGNNWFDLFVPTGQRPAIRAVHSTNVGGEEMVEQYENTIITRQGEERLVAWTNSTLRDGDGALIGTTSLGQDITEHRRAEESLIRERQRLYTVLETLPVYVILLTTDYHVPFANRVFRDRFGEARGRRCFEYLFGRSEPCEVCETYTVLKTRQPHSWEWRGPDGRIYDIYDFPFTDTDGSTLILEMGMDITERKHGQERLELAKTVIENSPTILFRWQAREGWPVEFVSENVARLGYTAAALMDGTTPYAAIVHPDDLARVAAEVERYTAAGADSFSQEYRLVTADGEIRTVDDRTRVERDDQGRVSHYQGIVMDITARKRLEAQLRQAQKMEAIGTLAGGIAHDFNNILAAIFGFAEIVMAELPPDSPQRQDVAQILKAGVRAKELVGQILTFSRRSEQRLQPLLIQYVVKEALKLLRASLPASIKIQERIDTDCAAILTDPTQINQVVMNLGTNAYQAMRATGGVLRVSLAERELAKELPVSDQTLAPGRYLVLEVSDSGAGIDPEVLGRIFEPYFTTKGVGEGTGMGLAIVHGIVAGLGGGIGVASAPGRGATFTVYLPVDAGSGTEIRTGTEGGDLPAGGDESILVLDDEEAIVTLFKGCCRAWATGYAALSTAPRRCGPSGKIRGMSTW